MAAILCWAGVAHGAGPDAPFARQGEQTRVRRYDRVTTTPPIRAVWRRTSGSVEAWVFPDGVIEHYRRYERRKPLSIHRFDSAGMPLTTVTLTDDRPTTVTVHGADQTLEVADWVPWSSAGFTFTVPRDPDETTDNGAVWRLDTGTLTIELVDPADPFEDAFGADLASTCACRILDRATAWLDGAPAARYRFRLPDVYQPREGHLWALPTRREALTPLLLILWVAPVGPAPESNLAPARAMMALVERSPS